MNDNSYSTEMYELLREVDQVYASVLNRRKQGDKKGADDLFKQERDLIRYKIPLRNASKMVQKINKSIRKTYKDNKLSSDEKRKKIDILTARKNRIYKRTMERIETFKKANRKK